MKKLLVLLAALMIITGTSCAAPKAAEPKRSVTLYREERGEIITLGYEEYMIGCLFGAISPSAGEEALKAAAVVLNTASLYRLGHGGEGVIPADFTDSGELPFCYVSQEEARELYGGSYELYLEKLSAAAEYGISHTLTYGGELIDPALCRVSTGLTDSGGEDQPYHREVKIAADKKHDDHISTAAYSEDTVRRALTEITGVSGLSADCSGWFSSPIYNDSGTLISICFGGVPISGERLREAFSLRSAAITIDYTEGRFVFTCRGWGDNLGMSISGAEDMARRGAAAEEILMHFYSGAELR